MKKLYLSQQFNKNYLSPELKQGMIDAGRGEYAVETDTNRHPYNYVVEKVVNATEPALLDLLVKSQVDGYCDDEDWEVVIRNEG